MAGDRLWHVTAQMVHDDKTIPQVWSLHFQVESRSVPVIQHRHLHIETA